MFPQFLLYYRLMLFLCTLFITHYVSLGSLILYAGFVIQLIVSGQMHPFGIFENIPQAYLNEMYIIAVCLMILAYWQHKANILRLIKGEERKTYLGKRSSENLSNN